MKRSTMAGFRVANKLPHAHPTSKRVKFTISLGYAVVNNDCLPAIFFTRQRFKENSQLFQCIRLVFNAWFKRCRAVVYFVQELDLWSLCDSGISENNWCYTGGFQYSSFFPSRLEQNKSQFSILFQIQNKIKGITTNFAMNLKLISNQESNVCTKFHQDWIHAAVFRA